MAVGHPIHRQNEASGDDDDITPLPIGDIDATSVATWKAG
jgi:hypothetical protein